MKTFALIVMGVSATGKSTRVMQIVEFVEKYLGGWKPVLYYNKEELKEFEVGMYNDVLNLIIVGKIYYSGKVKRFQGHDATTGQFGTSENYSEWMKSIASSHNLLAEGYSVLQSFRSRADHLINHCGFKEVMNLTFYYGEDKGDYLNRIILRSGKEPKTSKAWESKDKIFNLHKRAVSELEALGMNTHELIPHDKDVNYVGVKMFNTFYQHAPVFVEEFKKFVIDFNYINLNKFENFGKNG